MPGYVPLSALADQLYRREMENVALQQLNNNRRVSFYAIGFAEGELLDRLQPSWRERYLQQPFKIPRI